MNDFYCIGGHQDNRPRRLDLIQPRHSYAPPPESGEYGHVYLPTSLLSAASRLIAAGADVTIHDENLRPAAVSSSTIGISLLGAPYIPVVQRMQARFDREAGSPQYLMGGRVISGLSPSQFRSLFGDRAINGNDDGQVSRALRVPCLPAAEETSLIPAYRQISDADMRAYLSGEISLYVSQGCKYACDFCAALRSTQDATTGEVRRIKETYRNPSVIQEDLIYLLRKAHTLGIPELRIYMTNLDAFQTPAELGSFARAVNAAKQSEPRVGVKLRGLATVDSYLQIRRHHPRVLEDLADAGFWSVGFGIDGMTAQVWRKIHKGFLTEDNCIETIRSVKRDYDWTPEILMVFGHHGADTHDTLQLAVDFAGDMAAKHGAIPRPHVSKAFIPGNNGWRESGYADAVGRLIQYPDAFQALDFTALPSPLTHRDAKLRDLTEEYFLRMCSLPGNTTIPVKPISPGMSDGELLAVRAFNQGRYDR